MSKTSLVKPDVGTLANGQNVEEISDAEALKALSTSGLGKSMSVSTIKSRETLGRWLAPRAVNQVAVGMERMANWLERMGEILIEDAETAKDTPQKIAAAEGLKNIAVASVAVAQVRLKAAEVNSTRNKRAVPKMLGPQFNIATEVVQVAIPQPAPSKE